MYSDEIERLLKLRNYLISNEEYEKAFDTKISTQIRHIKYDPCKDEFSATTKEDNGEERNFNFKVYYKKKA